MPIFEYACGECNREFELLVLHDEPVKCPSCDSDRLSKLYSRFGMGGLNQIRNTNRFLCIKADAAAHLLRAAVKIRKRNLREVNSETNHSDYIGIIMTKLRGKKILPKKIDTKTSIVDLVDHTFMSYNAGRLREGCQLFVERMLNEDVTVGISLTGALTPAGIGMSCLIPLMQAGFIDWMVSTGANLYHDTHFGIGLDMHQGTPFVDDVKLRAEGIVRIYDIFFDYTVLLSTDSFYRELIRGEEFQRAMGTAEFHNLAGKYVAEKEKALGQHKSILTTAYECGIPIYTSSPGDSSIGMNIAAMSLKGNKLVIDPNTDVNETASIVLGAKASGGKSAVLIAGGGSPKNFVLQTEPQLQEVLGIEEKGHDYFLQITDARADTGGLSGATPGEAVSWGKIDPDQLPGSVVCYVDSTIALPILTAYSLAKKSPRPLKRLYDRRSELMELLRSRAKFE